MIEPEMAFYDLKDNMDLAEEFVKYLIKYLLDHNYEDLQFLNERYDKALLDRLNHVLDTPFERISYTDAVEILKNSKQNLSFLCWEQIYNLNTKDI